MHGRAARHEEPGAATTMLRRPAEGGNRSAHARRPVGSTEEGLERARARHVSQARQRLLLDLPHALARDAEQRTDLFERHRLLAIEAEVQTQDLGLALLQAGERLLDRL